MKMTFRWYGESDGIPLSYIKQIQGMTGVVTAVYDVPVGEVWPMDKILRLKELCSKADLSMEVIESVPVHEDIKLGRPSRDRLIRNYAQTIQNLGKAGVRCVCYNFMPVFDWFRTDLCYKHADGSTSLAYSEADFIKADVRKLRLPGWDESYTGEQLNDLLAAYEGMTHETLFNNLVYFLQGILPACRDADIYMAVHPDDPPWDIFGLPRIIGREADYDKLFAALPDRHNGITFCTGSLGAGRFNDLPRMASKYAARIHFAHLRQLTFVNQTDFYENGHRTQDGDIDMYAIVQALVRGGFKGYVRPDHGRNIWGEEGKPGYGLFDRALGAAYLNGLFEGVEKEEKAHAKSH
ncbi:MAG: mannonate dehydratase [Clostridia bacterium]|nr:mannonate dehydratase [Clostridia bacterium]